MVAEIKKINILSEIKDIESTEAVLNEKKEIVQVEKITPTLFKTAVLTVEFSEGKFKENYTFPVSIVIEVDDEKASEALDEAIKLRITKEIEIYKNKMDLGVFSSTDPIASSSLKIGQKMEA